MTLSRREVLKGLGSVAACAGLGQATAWAAGGQKRGGVRLTLGVMSDVHFGSPRPVGINASATEQALRLFRDAGVDAVMICGDIAHTGSIRQLERFGEVWRSVFPGDKGRDGRPVRKLFITGNHDVTHWEKPEKLDPAKFLMPHLADHWQRILGEKYEPISVRKVNGFTFVGAMWDAWDEAKLKATFDRVFRETPSDEPIFFYHHPPIPGTVSPNPCTPSLGFAKELFKGHPNVISISGHTHDPLADPSLIWQDEFTAVDTGAITNAEVKPFYCWPHGSPPGGIYSKGCTLWTITDERIVINRLPVLFGGTFGADWIIDRPMSRERFRYTAAKRALLPDPFFPKDAKVAVFAVMDERTLAAVLPSSGYKFEKQDCGIGVSFPAAIPAAGADDPIKFYTVAAVKDGTGGKVLEKTVVPQFYQGPGRVAPTCDCHFSAKELPLGESYRFEVTAHSCLGKSAKPIASAPFVRHPWSGEVD